MTTPVSPPTFGSNGPGGGNQQLSSSGAPLFSGTQDPIYGGIDPNQTIFLGTTSQTSSDPHSSQRVNGADFIPTTSIVNQTTTASNWIQQTIALAASNPKLYAAIQSELFAAGLYGSNQPTSGVYTSKDLAAMAGLLKGYGQLVQASGNSPIDINTYLTALAKQSPGSGPTRAPLSLTDPAELEQTLQQAAQSALGRDLSKSELAHFVSAFHGKEQSAYDAAGAGKTYTNPSVAGEALSFVDDNNSAEEDQFQEAGYVDAINKMLGVS